MQNDPVVFTIFLIFAGAALMATFALYARLSLLVIYIIVGIILGPSVTNVVPEPEVMRQVSHIGIVFLLFLLGINLQPQKMFHYLKQSLLITTGSCLLFVLVGAAATWLMGFSTKESIVVGAAMMFSSTIIGLKLLPTTVLHHKHTGEIIISVLLLQDLIAIVILMLLPAEWSSSALLIELSKLVLSLFGLILFAWLFSQYVLLKLIRRFNRIQEYIFLMAIGWCLSMAELAHAIGLSPEIGAFIAGVMLATNPIALFIAENLKPLRDFFLVIFFFTLGASFDLSIVEQVLWPSIALAGIFLLLKPYGFDRLLQIYGEEKHRAREVGVRLGQVSEFSLFIAVLALDSGVISSKASYLIQVSTLLSFVVSSWFIVLRYPTPIAVSEKLRRD